MKSKIIVQKLHNKLFVIYLNFVYKTNIITKNPQFSLTNIFPGTLCKVIRVKCSLLNCVGIYKGEHPVNSK